MKDKKVKVEFLEDRGTFKKGDKVEMGESLFRNLLATGKDSVKLAKSRVKLD